MNEKTLFVENTEYKYEVNETHFLLIAKKKKFAFKYNELKMVKVFNLNILELVIVSFLVLASSAITFWITFILGFYLLGRYLLSLRVLVISSNSFQEVGNVILKFDSQKEKFDFMNECLKYDDHFKMTWFKKNKKKKK